MLLCTPDIEVSRDGTHQRSVSSAIAHDQVSTRSRTLSPLLPSTNANPEVPTQCRTSHQCSALRANASNTCGHSKHVTLDLDICNTSDAVPVETVDEPSVIESSV